MYKSNMAFSFFYIINHHFKYKLPYKSINHITQLHKNVFYIKLYYMKNILFVFGTRPEVIKLAPVILELKKHPDKYNVIICNTEQQKELSNQTLAISVWKLI